MNIHLCCRCGWMPQLRSSTPSGSVLAPSWPCPATTPSTTMFWSNNLVLILPHNSDSNDLWAESNLIPFFRPPHRDTLTIAIINSLTSILAGFVIFSAFGYMSYLQGIPISDLAVDGKQAQIVFFLNYYNIALVSPFLSQYLHDWESSTVIWTILMKRKGHDRCYRYNYTYNPIKWLRIANYSHVMIW